MMFCATRSRCAALGAAVLWTMSLATNSSAAAPDAPAGHRRARATAAAAERHGAASQAGRDDEQSVKPPWSAVERKIDEELSLPTQMEFVETPLQDVIDFLKSYHSIEIQLDEKALKEAGLDKEQPITGNLKGIRLKSALNLTLDQLDLAWTVRDEVLLVTTRENAARLMTTKMYAVADLVACRDQREELWDDYDTLIKLIAATVEPTGWKQAGGPNNIVGATLGGAKVLTVAAPYCVQRQIVELLTSIRRTAQQAGKTEPPRRDRPEPGPW